jgi:hypothetical protein
LDRVVRVPSPKVGTASIAASKNRAPEVIQSFLLLVAAILGLMLPVLSQHKTDNQDQTEKACVAEWRASKATKAKEMTQAAFVQQCRSGTAVPQAAASSAAPSTNGTATPLQKPARMSDRVEKRRITDRHGRSQARRKIETQSRNANADSEQKFPTASVRR